MWLKNNIEENEAILTFINSPLEKKLGNRTCKIRTPNGSTSV